MRVTPTLISILLCVAFGAVEGVCAGPGVGERLRALRVPRFSLPVWAWAGIGVIYYGGCLVILRALFSPGLISPLNVPAIGLVLVMMGWNAAWNYVFFRRQDFRVSWLLTPPYSLVVLLTLVVVWRTRPSAVVWLIPYGLYQVYANFWVYSIWRLNEAPTTHAAA